MSTLSHSAKVDQLIKMLDAAVENPDCSERCQAIKHVLEDVIRNDHDFVDDHFMVPAPGSYARRLIHQDPADRYTLMAMVWDKGQGTALHDHAGMWCVECVYRGRIQVVSYDIQGSDEDPVVQFTKETTVFAGPGEAGALIPPFDYHTIENSIETPSVTLHVYGGEMKWCHAFVPVEGGYKREMRELKYTE